MGDELGWQEAHPMRRSRQSRPCSRDDSHTLATVCAKKAASLWRAIVGLLPGDEGEPPQAAGCGWGKGNTAYSPRCRTSPQRGRYRARGSRQSLMAPAIRGTPTCRQSAGGQSPGAQAVGAGNLVKSSVEKTLAGGASSADG